MAVRESEKADAEGPSSEESSNGTQRRTNLQAVAGRPASDLTTPQGRTSIADSVVQKIAGVSAGEVEGVHALGTGAARAFGLIKEKIPVGNGRSPAQGVNVEVGERQAAVDLDLVIDYGVSIPAVAQAVREHVISNIERMTGLEVIEVNINVDDVWIGDDEPAAARVQ